MHANGLGMFIIKAQLNITSSDTRDIFEREKTKDYIYITRPLQSCHPHGQVLLQNLPISGHHRTVNPQEEHL